MVEYFLKRNNVSLLLPENNFKYFLKMIRNLSFRSKIRIWENLYPTLWAWCFPILQDCSDDLSGDIHKCEFFFGIMKYVNI